MEAPMNKGLARSTPWVVSFPAGAPMTGEAVPILLDRVDREESSAYSMRCT
jgi:hypothetical protein